MKRYLGSTWGGPNIKEVEVERETESSVWVNGSIRRRVSREEVYFGTWEEAHSFICGLTRAARDSAHNELSRRESHVGKGFSYEETGVKHGAYPRH